MAFRDRLLFCALLLFALCVCCLADFSMVPTAVAGALIHPLHMHFVDSSDVRLNFGPRRFEECDKDCSFRKLLGYKGIKDSSGNRSSRTKLCSWNSRNSQCVVSNTVTAHYLRRARDAFANYAAQYAECSGLQSKWMCRSARSCYWDGQAKSCHFREITEDEAASPCHLNAPYTVGFLVFQWQCSGLDIYSCAKHPMCAWNSVLFRCDFDAFSALYGINVQEYIEVVLAFSPKWLSAFRSTFNTSDPDLNWKDVLEWSVPNLPCPFEVRNPIVCSLTKSIQRSALSTVYYCGFQYRNPSLCNRDALCFFDTNLGFCNIRESSLDAVAPIAQDALPYVQHSVDKEILEEMLACHNITQPNACSGSCIWIERSASCDVRDSWLYKRIAKSGKKKKDPLCTYFSLTSTSGCSTRGRRLCNKEPDCSWRSRDNFCLPSVDYMASHVFSENSVVRKPYEELQNLCQGRKKRASCRKTSFRHLVQFSH